MDTLPIKLFEQRCELGRREAQHAITDGRPLELAILAPLGGEHMK
jgi:hypothetical protein